MSEASPRTKMLVIYDGPNLRAFNGAHGDRIKLKPGQNTVNLSTWQKVKASKGSVIPLLITQGIIKELKPVDENFKPAVEGDAPGDADGDGSTDLKSYNAQTAIEVVENTLTDGELDGLEAQERAGKDRKTVLAAIVKQREEIKPPDDGSGDGD